MRIALNEAALDGFSLDYLRSIRSFKNRYNYCLQMLGKPIGRGSSRVVFQLDDDKVLKLAFNRKGIAQNEAEADWGAQNYGVVPKLYEVDDEYMYIIAEFVLPAKPEDFVHCIGMSYEDYQQVVRAIYNQYARRPVPCNLNWDQFGEIMENNEWLHQLNYYMSDYQPPFGDIERIQNIGLCERDGEAELVILDSGLNDDVYSNYYQRKW